MRKRYPFTFFSARSFLSAGLVVCMLMALISACKNNPEVSVKNDPGNAIPFACIRYDSAQLEYRLDSVQNRGFTMQAYLPEAGDQDRAYQLISYAFDTLGDYPNSWIPDTLKVVEDSIPRYFEGRVIIGNNEVTREQIDDLLNDKNGKRISYDYIVFSPVVEGNFNHLTYRLRPVKGNETAKGNEGKMQQSSPLPPSRVWK